MDNTAAKDSEKIVTSIKRRKWYHTVFMSLAAFVVFCTVYALILPAITLTTPTAPNPCLSHQMYSNTASSRRAYLEYTLPGTTRSYTFGILRQSVIYVYANAGETICLGSDVTKSRINENEVVKSDATGVDILMIGPDGTKYTFDNDAETGLGYIDTVAQETAGANFEGSGNTAGYIPHEFKVRQTGLYEVRFHSFDGSALHTGGLIHNEPEEYPHLKQKDNLANDGVTSVSNGEPRTLMLNNNNWCNSGCTVGAFDITVVNNGVVQTGRSYADYLAINMGSNLTSKDKETPNSSIYGDFYIVTSDGYIYKSDFELDPFGFLFFANSRGVVDIDTGYSSYHSVRGNGQNGAEINMTGVPYTVYTPQHEATDFDKTYMIFFEEPDPALQGILYQRAFAPGMATNLEFIGSKEGNITYVGNGGYFKFDVENAASATIIISFEKYNEEYNKNHPDEEVHYANVQINANVTKGTNYIYWDGNDANGVVIPEGWYREGNIEVEIRTHAGEIHFPFLDVESGNDITIERINNIFSYENGILTDITDRYDDSKYLLYYNNSIISGNRNCPNDDIIADGANHSTGVSSNNTAIMHYGKQQGDYTILDVWTYAVSKAEMEINTDLIVEDLDGYYTVNLNGLVFFDKDNSTLYNLTGGDFALDDVEVSLKYWYCGTRWSPEYDENDPTKIVKFNPAPHTSLGQAENGDPLEIIDYYYHNYELRRNEETGKYYLYKFDYTDTLHEQEPTLEKENGVPIELDVDVFTEEVENNGVMESITKYAVWIPVHRETTTDALGKYYFSGILVNENMGKLATDGIDHYSPPADHPEYNNITVSVKNPKEDLYRLTTANVQTNDFEGVPGRDLKANSQVISLQTLYSKIAAERALNSDKRNFFYTVSDVGYFYETYEPPISVVKHWGTIEDSNNIEKITFALESFGVKNGVTRIYDTRYISLNYYRWSETLTDLPASAVEDGETIRLSYRVSSETFVKYEMIGDVGHYFKYTYTYDWDSTPTESKYFRIETDADGNPLEGSTEQILSSINFPFETYIGALESIHTGDRIVIENWKSDTTYLTLTKYGAEDNVTTLPYATFKLQKEVGEGDDLDFVDVYTELGVYTVTTDRNGVAVFRGLEEGVYRIVETVAPEYYDLTEPIVFTVSKDSETGTDNIKVTGSYANSYETVVYDQLLEKPLSVMNKVDQYGSPISGAQYTFYKADKNFNYDPETDIVYLDDEKKVPATVTFDEEGQATLVKSIGQNKTRSLYISELRALLGDSDCFVLKETYVPDGYRALKEAHMKITGKGLQSYIICDNPYVSGVWAEPSATVYAPELLRVADENQLSNISGASYVEDGVIDHVNFSDNGRISSKGTLFAVVMKRNGAEPNQANLDNLTFEDWAPVYGNAIDGYHTISNSENTTQLDRVCQLIQMDKKRESVFEFKSNSDGTVLYTQIEDLPDRPNRYYTYMKDNKIAPKPVNNDEDDDEEQRYSDPQYAVLYYYSTATKLEDVTPSNTARVTSHGLYNNADKFTVHFSTNIYIPDISNNLFVQKTDLDNNLVDNAFFGLYEAVSESDGTGYYVGTYDVGENKETVYIRLSEDNNMQAEIYRGTINEQGDFVPSETVSVVNGTYSFCTDNFADVETATKDMVKHSDGRANGLPFTQNDAGYIIVTGDDGITYTIRPAKNADNNNLVIFTHDECDAVSQMGTGHMRKLNKGKYYLRELYAPGGFKLNYTNIEVFVGDEEVYANAGEVDDDVMVGNGPGYIISTLNQFASKGDIRETLTYIAAALRLNPSANANGFTDLTDHMSWPYVTLDHDDTTKYIFDGSETISPDIRNATVLYLMYNGSSNEVIHKAETIFDYCVNPNGATVPENTIDSLMFWTKSGWSDLAIFQHKTAAGESDANNPEITYTDISLDDNGLPNDISLLFSSSTFISVADPIKIGFNLKKVNANREEETLEGASFVLYKTDKQAVNHYYSPGENGEATWHTLEENETERDYAITTPENGIISYDGLENGDYYLKEIEAPTGFFDSGHIITVTVKGGIVTAVRDDEKKLKVNPPQDYNENGSWNYTVIVPNETGYMLPETGGNGTFMYFFGGLALVATAVVSYGFTVKKRKKRT